MKKNTRDTENKKAKTVAAAAAVAAMALCAAVLLSGCSFLSDLVNQGVDDLINMLQETDQPGTIDAAETLLPEATEATPPATDSDPTDFTSATDSDPTEITAGVTATPDSTPEIVPTATATYLPDTFIPGYGGNEILIDIDMNAEPIRFWKNTLTDPADLAAYESLEKMAENYTNVAEITQKISFKDMIPVYTKFMLDHPEFFWYGTHYTGIGYENKLTSFEVDQLYNSNQIKMMQKGIDEVANQVIASIPKGANDFEAELVIFDWLSSNVKYDLSGTNAYTLYGALIDRRCVCEGYAEAFVYLCAKVGIPAICIIGDGDNGTVTERHKWCAAQIGGQWYLVEPTWANSSTTKRYLYFNNSGYILPTHVANEELTSPLLPFTADSAEYLNYYGLTFEYTSDGDNFDEVFMRAVDHFIDLIPRGSPSATVLLRAPGGEAATKYAEIISDSGSTRISGLMNRVNSGRDHRYIIYGDAEVVDGDVIAFLICRT